MSVASRPVSTGKTRTCPHCKATILESLSICPGCMHHLRFDSEAAKRQVAAAPALRVEGVIRHPPLEQPLEYFVIIAIRNDRGEEVTRQVVNVGALQAAEKRTFTLSVEVLPPQAPVPTKSGATGATGTFKTPTPQPATAKPSAPAQGSTSSSAATPGGSSAASASPGAQQPTARPAPSPNVPGANRPAVPGGSIAGQTPGASSGSGASNPASAAPGSNNPVRPNPGAGSTNPLSSNPAAAKPPGATNPAGAANPAGATNPAGAKPADPASPPKPTSGYILKPPSPGGPKRH